MFLGEGSQARPKAVDLRFNTKKGYYISPSTEAVIERRTYYMQLIIVIGSFGARVG